MTFRTRLGFVAALAMLGAAATPAHASTVLLQVLDVDESVSLVVNTLDLSGTGDISLGAGWTATTPANVMTDVNVSLSGIAPSTIEASVVGSLGFDVDPDTAAFVLTGSLTASATATLFLDLAFEDVDPTHDFGGGLGPIFELPALVGKPLMVTVDLTLDAEQLMGLVESSGATLADAVAAWNAANPTHIIAPVVTDPGVERSLGVSFGGDAGLDDALSYSGASFLLSAFEDIAFEVIGSSLSVPTEISISALSMEFSGGISDLSADPPFSIPVAGSFGASAAPAAAAVPAPATLALLAAGFLAVGARRARR